MAGNSFGSVFRITTAGESHGPGNLVIVDGCPPGLELGEKDIQRDLDRRKPGQSSITTQRSESDQVQILSGVFEGRTTGTALTLLIPSQDARSADYARIRDKFRPGHADFTYQAKYGIRDYRGGGRASARETVSRVAAGAVARKLLAECGIEVLGYVTQVGPVVAQSPEPGSLTRDLVEANIVRCPDRSAAEEMIAVIEATRDAGDSIGGKCEILARGVPAGLGEPVFDKLKADLAKAILSIPAVTAFEYGSGCGAAGMKGSQHNDLFCCESGAIRTHTNRHGGILGGISSGNPILVRATVKPTSSIGKPQTTVDLDGRETSLAIKGRHDPCLLPRFVPVGEAMVLLTLIDHLLRWQAQCGFWEAIGCRL